MLKPPLRALSAPPFLGWWPLTRNSQGQTDFVAVWLCFCFEFNSKSVYWVPTAWLALFSTHKLEWTRQVCLSSQSCSFQGEPALSRLLPTCGRGWQVRRRCPQHLELSAVRPLRGRELGSVMAPFPGRGTFLLRPHTRRPCVLLLLLCVSLSDPLMFLFPQRAPVALLIFSCEKVVLNVLFRNFNLEAILRFWNGEADIFRLFA